MYERYIYRKRQERRPLPDEIIKAPVTHLRRLQRGKGLIYDCKDKQSGLIYKIMERNINALLEAANYVRFETLINGNQAAELDNLINSVTVAMDQVEDRKGKTTGRLSAMLMAKAEERLNAATEALYTWLKEFKANRPNVAINIDQEEPATEASKEDYSHAANCLDTYLNNDSFIYENHTQKAIEAIVNEEMAIDSPVVSGHIRNAINRAKWEVEKHDHLTPTIHDIETVKANYVAYIIECAQYEAKQAI